MPIRPFGYEADRQTIRQDEAELIRDAASRVAAGEPIMAIVREWNDRGIRTTADNMWQQGVLRRVLRSERIAGKRIRSDGTLVDADYPGILDGDLYDRLRAQLAVAKPGPEGPASIRTYLLTGGVAVCGLCSKPLQAKMATKGKRSYACVSASPGFGCGKVRINGDLLDDEVSVRIMAKFRRPSERAQVVRLIESMHARAGDADRVVKEARTRLADIGEEFARGRVAVESLRAATAELKAEIQAARRSQRTAEALRGVAVEYAENFVAWWEGASLDQQRTVLRVLVKEVAVMPAPVKGSRIFAPERVKVRWN